MAVKYYSILSDSKLGSLKALKLGTLNPELVGVNISHTIVPP